MSELKQYLSDSVYANFDGYALVLTTENGMDPVDASNTIVLDGETLAALDRYREWLKGQLENRAASAIRQEASGVQFWAYLHANGHVIVKRWFGDHKDYTEDCDGNDFVQQVVPPFTAANHEEATKIATEKLK